MRADDRCVCIWGFSSSFLAQSLHPSASPPFPNDLFVQNAAWAVLLEPLLTDFLCALFIRSPLLFSPLFLFFGLDHFTFFFFFFFLFVFCQTKKFPTLFLLLF